MEIIPVCIAIIKNWFSPPIEIFPEFPTLPEVPIPMPNGLLKIVLIDSVQAIRCVRLELFVNIIVLNIKSFTFPLIDIRKNNIKVIKR